MSIQIAKLKNFASRQTVLGLVLAIIFTLTLEHSAIDVAISQYFYSPTDGWLLAKESLLPNLIFYTLPKRLLIAFEVYMAIAWLQRYLYQTQQLQYCPLSSRQGFNGIHLFSKVTPSLTGGIYNSFVTLETTI